MTAEGERVLIETGCASGVCLPLSDHAMFKGATMRHLGYLRRFAEGGCKGSGGCMRRVARLRDFADTNAESCWWHAREERLLYQRNGAPRTRQLFDNDWRGPYAVDSTGEIDPSLSLPARRALTLAWLAVATSQIAALGLFASLLDDGAGSAPPPAPHRHPPAQHVDGRLRELAWAGLLLACVAGAGAGVVCYRRRKRSGDAAAALLDGGVNDPAAAGGTSPDPRPRLL